MNIKSLIEDGYVVVLDTNVLLNLYTYSPDFAEFAIRCLNSVVDAIRLPATVVREFAAKHHESFRKRSKLVESSEKRRLNRLSDQKQRAIADIGELEKLNYPDIDRVKEQFLEGFGALEEVLKDYFSKHEVLNLIKDTWDNEPPADLVETVKASGHVLPEPTVQELYELTAEGQRRFAKKTPPGYKDENKDGLRQYNDLIIWKEILNYAKQERKGIIFVTDDVKSDWWDHSGTVLKFHEKLIEEFERETVRKVKNRIEYLNIVALTSNEFYSLVSDSYDIPRNGMIELALKITNNDYVDSIKDDVFCEIANDLVFSDDLYLDFLEHSLGTEGVAEWEIESNELEKYEVFQRDEKRITYKLTYQVQMIGDSQDYWGRDDDTKDPILSPGYEHEVEGSVEVLVQREVGEFTDFESDQFFESATLFNAAFTEIGFTDYGYDENLDWE